MSHASDEPREFEPLLNTSDVSRITGRAVSTLEKDRVFGTGPGFVKIGRSVKYRPRDVREWLQRFQTVHSNVEAREASERDQPDPERRLTP